MSTEDTELKDRIVYWKEQLGSDFPPLYEPRLEDHLTEGMKVRFANPNSGYEYDQEMAKVVLVYNQWYTVKAWEQGTSHTYLYLDEVVGIWNSVLFEEA